MAARSHNMVTRRWRLACDLGSEHESGLAERSRSEGWHGQDTIASQ